MKTRSNFGIKRTAKYLLMFAAVILVLSFLLPVKFAKGYLEDMKEEEFFIVTFVAEQSTEGGSCILLGDQDGYFDDEDTHYVTFDGVDFRGSCAGQFIIITQSLLFTELLKRAFGGRRNTAKNIRSILSTQRTGIYTKRFGAGFIRDVLQFMT